MSGSRLRPPQTSNIQGSTDYYKETDYYLNNLISRLHPIYGQRPVIWRRYNSNNELVIIGGVRPLFIFKQPDTGKYGKGPVTKWGIDFKLKANGLKDYSQPYNVPLEYAPNEYEAAPMAANIGSEDEISVYCGTESIRSISENTAGRYFGGSQPDLKRRGIVSMGADGGTYAQVGRVSSENGVTFDRFTKAEDIMRYFRNWVYQVGLYTKGQATASAADNLAIWVVDPEFSGGKAVKIDNLDKLSKYFPEYLYYEKMAQNEWLSSIAGVRGLDRNGNEVITQQGLWQMFSNRGLTENEIRRELLNIGFTEAQVNEFRNQASGLPLDASTETDNPLGGSTSGGSSGSTGGSNQNSGGGRNADGTLWKGPEGYQEGRVSQIIVQRSRNLFLEAETSLNAFKRYGVSYDGSSPVMYQVYMDGMNEADSAPGTSVVINQYVFDMIPKDISYSNFAGEWVSIERTGSFPFIDWKNFKLLQVSFQFTIAEKNGFVTADGLLLPVTKKIEMLQRMAQTPFPVMFYGFDTLLTNQFRYDNTGTPRGVQFVIQDLSITATQRDADLNITRATASITLQEIPIEKQTLIGMPRLKHKAKTPDEPTTTQDPEYGLATDTLIDRPSTVINYTSESDD